MSVIAHVFVAKIKSSTFGRSQILQQLFLNAISSTRSCWGSTRSCWGSTWSCWGSTRSCWGYVLRNFYRFSFRCVTLRLLSISHFCRLCRINLQGFLRRPIIFLITRWLPNFIVIGVFRVWFQCSFRLLLGLV